MTAKQIVYVHIGGRQIIHGRIVLHDAAVLIFRCCCRRIFNSADDEEDQ